MNGNATVKISHTYRIYCAYPGTLIICTLQNSLSLPGDLHDAVAHVPHGGPGDGVDPLEAVGDPGDPEALRPTAAEPLNLPSWCSLTQSLSTPPRVGPSWCRRWCRRRPCRPSAQARRRRRSPRPDSLTLSSLNRLDQPARQNKGRTARAELTDTTGRADGHRGGGQRVDHLPGGHCQPRLHTG